MRLPSLMGLFGVFEGKTKTEAEVDTTGNVPCSPTSAPKTPRTTNTPRRISSYSSLEGDRAPGSKQRTSNSKPLSRAIPKHSVAQQADAECIPWTMPLLEETMQEVADHVRDWEEGEYTMIANLQDAVRNHGRVDLMRMSEAEGGEKVAVKRMPNRWVRPGPKEFQATYPTASEKPWFDLGVVRELNKIGFPYACQLLDVFRDQENTYVATTLATDGDLFSWCDRDPKPGPEREEVMKPIIWQILAAVRWLHELGVAHRDLSLENILLTEMADCKRPRVKIIDFGMATLSQRCRREIRGKQSYQAPEMHAEFEYDTYLSDAFALGVVMFAMAAQDYPWTSTKRNACQLYEYVSLFGFRKFLEKRRLRKGSGEHLIAVFSPELVDLLDGLLEAEPQDRLCLGEKCYGEAATSVWTMGWLEGVEPPPVEGLSTLAGG